MPTLNNKVRDELTELIMDELKLVTAKANVVAGQHWAKAESSVGYQMGYGDVVVRIEHLKNQIEGLQNELAGLQGSIAEKARPATVDEYHDAGITVSADRYGRIYSKPIVFGREISSVWDLAIITQLNKDVPLLTINRNLSQLSHVIKREMLLSGTFEDARALYVRFHSKILAAVGDEVPGLLAHIEALPALSAPDGQ